MPAKTTTYEDMELHYGALEENNELVDVCENLNKDLKELKKILAKLIPLKAQYNKMSLPAKIEFDLFFAFTLNSLHWIDLRVHGIDPSQHPIKFEIQRLKAAMGKWQEYKSRDKRPTVNIEAARRFIRSGLYDRYRSGEPPNKKTLFNDEE